MSEKSEALKRAIDAVGKAEALAAKLGISPQALSQWGKVPPLRVLDVERITGVSRHDLRPDLYPVPADLEAKVFLPSAASNPSEAA